MVKDGLASQLQGSGFRHRRVNEQKRKPRRAVQGRRCAQNSTFITSLVGFFCVLDGEGLV